MKKKIEETNKEKRSYITYDFKKRIEESVEENKKCIKALKGSVSLNNAMIDNWRIRLEKTIETVIEEVDSFFIRQHVLIILSTLLWSLIINILILIFIR